MKKTEKQINDALLKVALGFRIEEVTEEYAEVDGSLKLTKRRETKRDIPPDLKAVQLLLAEKSDGTDYTSMSEEELKEEKDRLLAELRKEDAKKVKSGGRGALKKTKTDTKRADKKGGSYEA